MNFRNYIEGRGFVGGAFGNQRSNFDYGIMHKHDNYQDRVNRGLDMERRIIEAMNKVLKYRGEQLLPSSIKDDTRDHIDAFWKRENGTFPVQIKYRDKGSGKNDILLEVMKKFDRMVFAKPNIEESDYNGRDMSGRAIYYFGVDSNHANVRIINLSEARKIAKELVEDFAKIYRSEPLRRNFENAKGMVRITVDPSNHLNEKLMVYLKPAAFSNMLVIPIEI
jgi:hypothetical protein